MAKVNINLGLDYLVGYLRYGHREGTIDIPDEELKEFEEDPVGYLKDNDLTCELEFIVDDYEIDDCAYSENDIQYKILKN